MRRLIASSALAVGLALGFGQLEAGLLDQATALAQDEDGQGENGIPRATPELGSIALFGAGAAGLSGYIFARVRAGRRTSRSWKRSQDQLVDE